MLNRVLDKRRVKTETDLKGMKEKELELLKKISVLKKSAAPDDKEEMQRKVEELQEFQKVAIGREMKMIELKKKLEELKKKRGSDLKPPDNSSR